MKLLSLKINNSINCVINFDNPNRYAKTYVINNMSNDPVLFSLQTAKGNGETAYVLQTERGRKDLIIYSMKDVENDVADMSKTVTNVSTENLISKTLTLKFLPKDYSSANLSNEQKARIDKEIHEYKSFPPINILQKHGKFLCSADSNKIVEYTIVLTIGAVSESGNLREISSSLKIVLCPRKNIYQATLDFGSEASQALLYNCAANDISGNNILPLFSQLASTLGKDIVSDERHPDYMSHNIKYVQFDKDKHLFRSHFMAPCYVDITKDEFIPAKSPRENPHLKLLTTFTEIEMFKTKNASASGDYAKTYFTLPNVKIASLMHDRPTVTVKTNDVEASVDATEFCHRYFYRSAINSFIYQILKNTAFRAAAEKTIAYLRLTVLMPNVYNQKNLSIRMRDINEDINGLLNLAEFSGVIRGVEVNSISESDASILGFMNADKNRALTLKKGNYLIIDAGKGTLDFSVLRFDPHAAGQKFLSLYRSGIVGSGNAISYAVFLDLISHLLSSLYKVPQKFLETGVKAIIRHLIMDAEEATLAELMIYVERYKRYYGETCYKKESGTKKSAAPNENPNEKNNTQYEFIYIKETNELEIKYEKNIERIGLQKDIVEGIKDLFESPNNLESSSVKPGAPTDLLYTERMINQLKDDALKAFGYIGKLDYVVMTGRAIHLPQFKDAIFNGIKSVPSWADVQLIQWEDSNQVINAKNICLYANQMLSHGKYDGRVVGRPKLIEHGKDPVLYKTDEEKAEMSKFIARLNGKKSTRWAVGPCRAIESKFKDIQKIGWLFHDYKSHENDETPATMYDKDYLKGVSIEIKSELDQIAISGTNYKLPDNAEVKTHATIYFDGDEFLFVCNNTAQDFDPVVLPSVFHVFESTFPYGFTSGDIPIPKQSVMKSTLKPVDAEKSKQENNHQKDLTKDL